MTAPDEHRPPDDPAGFLRWYRRAWNDLDLDRIWPRTRPRASWSRAGGCSTTGTRRPRPGTSGTCWTATGGQGPHRWDLGDLEQRPLGRDGALVTVCWTCRRPDGSTIWEFLDSHLLASERGRWWIVGDVAHQER